MDLGQAVEARTSASRPSERGYAMAALLVGLSIMAVLMGAALPVWSQQMKREREEELIWRGNQYARAVGLFQRKYANTFPPTIDILVEQRFLRKKYKDPMTNDDFQPIPAGGGVPGQISAPGPATTPRAGGGTGGSATPTQGFSLQRQPSGNAGGVFGGQARAGQQPAIGIQGVVSKSKEASIKIYNGRTKYNEWAFVYLATAQRITPGGAFPGAGNQPGMMPGTQPGMGPGGRSGFGPPGSQGRPPVGFPGGGTTFRPAPGPTPFGPNSPFAPPPGIGAPRSPGQPPPRPPG
jgi:type II secretory pathway pseudopilin PulG